MIEGVQLTPLRIIENPKGDIYHALKASETGYQGFGEAYFSSIDKGEIKGWKRHNTLALNLVVPVGEIRFIIHDDRSSSISYQQFYDVTLGIDSNYRRLTVSPGLWVAFQGKANFNLLLNIISEEHKPSEADNLPLDHFVFPNTNYS